MQELEPDVGTARDLGYVQRASAWWVAGLVIVLAVMPVVRRFFEMDDVLDLYALFMPWWALLQMAVLAGVLGLVGKRARGLSARGRVWAAAGATVLAFLVGPTTLTLVGLALQGFEQLTRDPVQVALLWTVPLAYFVVPAAIVVRAFLRQREKWVWLALGQAFVAIGVGGLLVLPWYTQLWARYVATSGGPSL